MLEIPLPVTSHSCYFSTSSSDEEPEAEELVGRVREEGEPLGLVGTACDGFLPLLKEEVGRVGPDTVGFLPAGEVGRKLLNEAVGGEGLRALRSLSGTRELNGRVGERLGSDGLEGLRSDVKPLPLPLV